MSAYYNEFDKHKAAWLRELIARNVIAPGDVDERSIHDVRPGDLRGYTQCHWFAGIGVWSYAMRLAGWNDDRPAWTGSCPCPSFSAAGKGEGFDDPRHLWPVWMPLIRESSPAVVFGEQADGAIGHGWLDLVSTDLEAISYAFGAAVLGACCVGSPNRRQRLYFVADSNCGLRGEGRSAGPREEDGRWPHDRLAGRSNAGFVADSVRTASRELAGSIPGAEAPVSRARIADGRGVNGFGGSREDGSVAESMHAERWTQYGPGEDGCNGEDSGRPETYGVVGARGEIRELADSADPRRNNTREHSGGRSLLSARSIECGATGEQPRRSSPLNGFWRDADWIFCRDGKWRPVRPGSFPLASGSAARVVRLRGYGDAINAYVAAEFIRAYMEASV